MARQPTPSTAELRERLATRLHELAFNFLEQSRSFQRYERMVDDGERIAAEIVVAVRERRHDPDAGLDRLLVPSA